MIKIFIKSNDNTKDKYIEIFNTLLSVYSLKLTIYNNRKNLNLNFNSLKDINLIYNGKILEDSKSLLEYNINNNSTIFLNKNLKGGSTTGSILIVLALILSFIIIGLLLISGILFFISNGFSYGLASALKYFINIAIPNTSIGRLLRFLKIILIFLVNIFSNVTFLFFMTFIWFFIVYYRKENKYCGSLGAAFYTSIWVCVSFLIIFLLFGFRPIMNFFLKRKLGEDTPAGIIRKFFNFIGSIIESLINLIISLIPFYGTYYAFMSFIVGTSSSIITKLGKARNIDDALENQDNIELIKILHEYLCAYIDSEKLSKNARNIFKNPEEIIEKINKQSDEIKGVFKNLEKNKTKYNFLKKCTSSSDTITQAAINQLGLTKILTSIYKVILLNDFYINEFEGLKNKEGCYEQYNPFNKITFNYYYNVLLRYPIYNNLLKIGTKILWNIYNMYYGRSDYENRGEVYDEADILQLFRSTSLAGFIAFIVFLVLAIWKGIFGQSAAGYKYKK